MRASEHQFVMPCAPVLDRSVFYCAWCGDETCDCNSLPTFEQVRDTFEETEHARREAA